MSEKVFTRDDMRRALGAAIHALDGKAHLVDGYDAEFWHGSYVLLREAIEEHLAAFLHDDDVAEEAIYIEAIRLAGIQLALVGCEDAASNEHSDALPSAAPK